MIKLPDETEMKWRDLALQFDGHRMQAISLLKMIINDAPDDQYLSVRNFLKSGPLPGEEVLRNRIAEIAEVQRLNATAQPVSDWQREAERKAEQHGMSFVLFRNGEKPKCADPTKVRIEFTDKGLGYPAAPGVQDD